MKIDVPPTTTPFASGRKLVTRTQFDRKCPSIKSFSSGLAPISRILVQPNAGDRRGGRAGTRIGVLDCVEPRSGALILLVGDEARGCALWIPGSSNHALDDILSVADMERDHRNRI